jgi:hypothetical protein
LFLSVLLLLLTCSTTSMLTVPITCQDSSFLAHPFSHQRPRLAICSYHPGHLPTFPFLPRHLHYLLQPDSDPSRTCTLAPPSVVPFPASELRQEFPPTQPHRRGRNLSPDPDRSLLQKLRFSGQRSPFFGILWRRLPRIALFVHLDGVVTSFAGILHPLYLSLLHA